MTDAEDDELKELETLEEIERYLSAETGGVPCTVGVEEMHAALIKGKPSLSAAPDAIRDAVYRFAKAKGFGCSGPYWSGCDEVDNYYLFERTKVAQLVAVTRPLPTRSART